MVVPLLLAALAGSAATGGSTARARLGELKARLRVVPVVAPVKVLTPTERFFAPALARPEWMAWGSFALRTVHGGGNLLQFYSRATIPYYDTSERMLSYRDWLVSACLGNESVETLRFPATMRAAADFLQDLVHQQKLHWDPYERRADFIPEDLQGSLSRLPDSPSFPSPSGVGTVRLVPALPVSKSEAQTGLRDADKGAPGLVVRAMLDDASVLDVQGTEWRARALPFATGRGVRFSWVYTEPARSGPPWSVLVEFPTVFQGNDSYSIIIVDTGHRIDGLLELALQRLKLGGNRWGYFIDDFVRVAKADDGEDPRLRLLAGFLARGFSAIQDVRIAAKIRAWAIGSALPTIIDWASQTGTRLDGLSLQTALDRAVAWHNTLAQQPAFEMIPGTHGVELVRWVDGATLQVLDSRAALRDEGTSMGHCIGGPHDRHGIASGESHYIQSARDGEASFWSYRDPDGRPQATIEVYPDMHRAGAPDTSLSWVQVQGPNDGDLSEVPRRRLKALYLSLTGLVPVSDRPIGIELSANGQAFSRLLPVVAMPIRVSDALSMEAWAKLSDWRQRWAKLRADSSAWLKLKVRVGRSYEWDTIYNLFEEGLALLMQIFEAAGVRMLLVPDPDGYRGRAKIVFRGHVTGRKGLGLVAAGTLPLAGWRLEHFDRGEAFPRAFDDPWGALIDAGIVDRSEPIESASDDPVFFAPVEAWAIHPWSTPRGNI